MRIAIVNDDRDEIYKIQELIFNIHGNYRVDQYMEGRRLLEAAERGEVYDLLLCDTYLKGESGIEIAKRMRALSPQTPIAFITGSREHAVEAFSVEAVHYLVKPVSQEDIVEIFQRLKKKEKPRHTLTIRIDRVINVLYQDEILRIESHGHNTEITCENHTVYSIRKAFREIDELLDDSFLQVKKGVTLNMNSIVRMTYKDCTTRDGKSYLLSRSRAKQIRDRYYTFAKDELNRM